MGRRQRETILGNLRIFGCIKAAGFPLISHILLALKKEGSSKRGIERKNIETFTHGFSSNQLSDRQLRALYRTLPASTQESSLLLPTSRMESIQNSIKFTELILIQ